MVREFKFPFPYTYCVLVVLVHICAALCVIQSAIPALIQLGLGLSLLGSLAYCWLQRPTIKAIMVDRHGQVRLVMPEKGLTAVTLHKSSTINRLFSVLNFSNDAGNTCYVPLSRLELSNKHYRQLRTLMRFLA